MIEDTIYHGELPMITAGPIRSRGERGVLDAVTYEIITGLGNEELHAKHLGFEYERKVAGYHSMWVQTLDDEAESSVISRVSIRCVGLLKNDKKLRRRLSVAGKEVSIGPIERVVLVWTEDEKGSDDGTPVEQVRRRVPKLDSEGEVVYKSIATPSGAFDRWNVREAILVLNLTYFVTVEPETSVIGTAMTPENPPTPPPFIWSGYGEPMRANHPNGWVLDDRQVDEIFTAPPLGEGGDAQGLWAVEDTFGYYYTASPD